MFAELSLESGATLSHCRTYRYLLWRNWSDGPRVAFIGLNPSTADEQTNDPTITRCIRFAKDWGYSGLVMLNLFALRSTDPAGLKKVLDPVGPDNDASLVSCKRESLTIAAWGVHGEFSGRASAVLELFRKNEIPLHCLGRTKAGFPKHPLYLPATAKPEGYG